jgi:hypothetical protein
VRTERSVSSAPPAYNKVIRKGLDERNRYRGFEQAGYDPVALADSLASAADKSAKLLGDYLARQSKSGPSLATDEFG